MNDTTTFPTWQHRFTATRRVPLTADERKYLNGKRLTVEAGLHYLEGNRRPYFSVTCVIYEQARNNRWADVGGGAAHETILKVFPKLAPVVALHLADDDGTPSHGIENGLYWLGLSQFPDARNLDTFRRVLRLSEDETREVDAYLTDCDDKRAGIVGWFESHGIPARWQAEADAARTLLDELIAAKEAKQ